MCKAQFQFLLLSAGVLQLKTMGLAHFLQSSSQLLVFVGDQLNVLLIAAESLVDFPFVCAYRGSECLDLFLQVGIFSQDATQMVEFVALPICVLCLLIEPPP
jgi:hypothetical protein